MLRLLHRSIRTTINIQNPNLKAIAEQYGWKISGSGSYVKGIGGEMEKSAGALSGWTYTVNGDTPNKSAGSYKLKDGDSVDWKFVDGPDY